MNTPTAPLRSYQALLWPADIEASDVEDHAARGALPILRVQAPDADKAAELAALVSGQHVLRVERVEAEPAAAVAAP